MRDAPPSQPQRPTGLAFRHRFEGPGYRRVLLGGVRRIPPSLQRASMPLWAGIFYALVPEARRVIERNLEQVCGAAGPLERKRRSFRLFINYAQSLANMYSLHVGQDAPVEARTLGAEVLLGLGAQGRGAVVVTGHMGFWQIAPFLMAKKEYRPMTMAMAEEPNAALAAYEEKLRAKHRIVYTTRSPFATLELAQILRRGELVGMQLDRCLGGPGVSLPFFGRPARFPTGPATLARATECPLVPVFIVSTADRRRCTFHVEEPIEVRRSADRAADVREATARVVEVYARFVRRYPEQWFNFYDFWSAPA